MSLVVKKKGDSPPIAKNGNNKVFVEDVHDNENEVKEISGEFTFIPYIQENQVLSLFISGVAGSGKSSFARNSALALRKIKRFKKQPIFFISVAYDGTLESLDNAYSDIEDFNPICIYHPDFLSYDWETYQDCIVILDDWDRLNKKDPIFVHLNDLVNKLLSLGRKKNTNVIIINHQTMDYNKTRNTIFECNTYCIFPKSNQNSALKFIRSYVSDDKDVLEKIKKMKGNQFSPLIIHKTAPQYLLCNEWIKLL